MSDPQILLTGLALGESPRWHQGRLWFGNWGAGEVVAVAPDGRTQVMARVPSFTFCLDWLPDGRLLVTSGEQVRRLEADASLATHADLAGLGCHMLNEIVVDGRGRIYVNDIGFNLMTGAPFAPGCIALLAPDGSARRVAEYLAFPNGMAITPDNGTLVVAESYQHRLTAFDIAPDGGLSNRRVWAKIPDSAPDGICLDAEGAVWYADVPNRHCLRVRAAGQVLQTVPLDRGGFACMLGGADRQTLFILAAEWNGAAGMAGAPRTGQLLTVEAPAPGAGWP
jgi:sugar lactone lactonase YvrE